MIPIYDGLSVVDKSMPFVTGLYLRKMNGCWHVMRKPWHSVYDRFNVGSAVPTYYRAANANVRLCLAE